MDAQINQKSSTPSQNTNLQQPAPTPKPQTKSKLLIPLIIIILFFTAFILITNNQSKSPVKNSPRQTGSANITPAPSTAPENYKIINGSLYKILPAGKEILFIGKSSVKDPDPNYPYTIKEIAGFEISPDKTKMILWGEDDNYRSILYYTQINNLQFKFIGNSLGGIWSPNSQYIAYTAKHTDAGPYELSVFDTAENKDAETIKPELGSYTNYSNPVWEADSRTIRTAYETYDPLPPHGTLIASGEAEIKIKK